jgi:hypothetical protein
MGSSRQEKQLWCFLNCLITLLNIFSEYGHSLGSVIYRHKNLLKGLSGDSYTSGFFMNHLSKAPFLLPPFSFFLLPKIRENIYQSRCLFQLKTFLFRVFTPLGSMDSTYKLIFTNAQCMLGVHKLLLYGSDHQRLQHIHR